MFQHFFSRGMLRNLENCDMKSFSNKNTRTRCEICSKLTIKTPERRQWCCSGVFIVNFEHISHVVLVFLLLTLNMNLGYVNVIWDSLTDINQHKTLIHKY